MSYPSGDVTARLTLDISDFTKQTKEAENQATALKESLKSSLNSGGVGDGLKSSLETLKKEFTSLIDESKLLKSIDDNLIKLTDSFRKGANSAGEFGNKTLTEFNKMQREATLLKDKLNTLFETKVSNTNTMSTSEFDKINATLTKAGEQLSVFKGKTDSLAESANVTDSAFARWSGTIQKAETYISQLKAQMNSMNVVETTPKINTNQDIDRISRNLRALADAGHSFTLSLGEGFQRVDNSLINTNEKIARFTQYLDKTGDANLINSVANQLSTMQGKLDATNEASLKLVNTLRGMGEVTGVSIPLNGQMVELKGSMVATEESANELIMALRQLDPALIEVFTLALQNMKSNMAQIKAETEAVNQSFFKQNLSMDIEGFNNVDAFNKNLEAIERTKTQIKELIAYTKELGITPLGDLNGELVSLDENLFQSGMRAESLDEILKTMSSPQLNTVNEQLGVMKKQLSGLTADARLFKETLATINVPKFNSIPTGNNPALYSQNISIERTLSLIKELQLSYEQLGVTSSLSFTTSEGKLITFDEKLLQTKEGLIQLKEQLSQLNASSLARLETQLEKLNTQTKKLTDNTLIYIDTLGNARLVTPIDTSKMKKDMDDVGKSSENTRKNLEGQKKSVNALDSAYGILRRTLSLIVVMFGFQLAMELFNVGKEAMDASYKIKTLGESMGWTAQQTQKFQSTANRLQKIYPKLDMNATAKSVMDMAKIYDMTNDEATKFIETAAVFNSAMIKEGRSTEDASLALKDYLDLGSGWSRRMSEIISDKQELIDTGYWDGETQDINAQIKALDAVLKKKHYHEMAKEIYTLDEAYRALQFRIGMFIGQSLQALTPYIISAVKGFLGLLDAIEGVGNALKGNPIFEAVTMFLGIAVSVGILSKGLAMLKIKLAETAVSFLRVFTLNPHLVAIALAIAAIVTVVYELGKAFGWWKDIPSMIDKITQSLGTLQGQLVAVGTAIGGVLLYFGAKGWITESNMIVKAIQKVIDKLKDYIKNKRKAYDIELPDTEGKGKGKGKTKTPDLPDTKDVGWSDVGKSLRQIGLQAIKAGAYIAVGMALMAEAIILIQLPMRALASTGDYFKSDEANIRKGIDGLKLVAPTILAFAVPVTAIMIAMGYIEKAFKISLSSIIKSAVAITAGMALISWAIGLLVAPMLALSFIGGTTALLKGAVQEGIRGINLISEAIMALVPVVPMFAVAITAGAIVMASGPFSPVTFGVAVIGLATGMALVAVAIGTLFMPLGAIAGLGALPIDMEGVKKGAEAIKQVSIALQYLSDAMNSVASIVVADLAMKIVNLFGNQDWTGLAGSMKKVEEATDSIQTVAKTLGNLSVPDINQEEIKKLGQVAEATKNIKSALDSISGIMNQGNIGGETRIKFGLDGISVFKVDILTELKAKMRDITNFINAFNGIEVPAFDDKYTDKINRIKQVVEAVKQITSALKGIGDIGTSGGIAGGLSWVIWGDLASKYGILFQNIKSTVTFVRRVSQEIKTDNINGEAINRIKNIASHIPSIVNSTKSVQTSLQGEVGNGIEVNQKLILIRNQISAMVNFAKMMSSLSTEGVTADSLSRINNITQNVVNIVNKLKTLRTTIGGDVGNGIDLNNKLILIKNQISAIQNFVVNVVQLGTTVDTGGVLTAIGTATTNVVNISNKLNALNTSLGANTQTGIGLNQKLTLLKNQISAIRNFVNGIGGGINGTGTAIGNITASVTALQNAISNFGKTVDGAISGLKGKGENLGNAFASGFKSKVGTIKNTVNEMKSSIGTMASYGVARADDLSVHFSTFGNRVDTAKGKVDALKGAIDSLPDNKTINIGVNINVHGSLPWGLGLSFPSAFGLGLSGIHNTVSSGFGGVIRGIRGLKGIKTLSAPVGGGFVDAFKSVIGGMRYSHYYGTKNNGNVTDTLNSGESNCVDGALATLQLARMFGLDGKLGTTMVNGEGHAFAIIEGKIFDATAMQLLGRTKAPNVRYSASNPTQKDKKKESKKEINIIVDMTDSTFYGDEDFEKKAEKLFNRLALELLDVDKNDGV